ncbi:MAG: tRNA uridine-5-carboxymethylaminomethyl(34) synthesis GTPase MnmE [Mucilaginibacter polytrichastri]|nr:tRNA uridine-5-carboxymethylaminomethyl(34) synthesis GTPase MnmE [Mucilaginibacter polytrichastri]
MPVSHPSSDSDTIVALATPPGIGALAIIRLSGPDAITLVNAVFTGKNLEQQKGQTLHFGTIRDGDEVIDEVLVSVFRAPHSHTRENVAEISTHGSPYIINRILHLLIDKGARPAGRGEFTMRAFLNGQMDLSQAEAVADLIAADSKAAHDVAFRQMRGGYSSELNLLREELIHFASLIELELDFSEEDVEFADRSQLFTLITKIAGTVRKMIRSFELGNVLKNGVVTVLAGRPNAGKSTLMNALLNEERAIVSDIPGTTRDTIEEVLNISGISFRLVDTAGIREATDTIEAIGVQRTLDKISQSALLLYVFDVSSTTPEELSADLNRLSRPGLSVIAIANKIDLAPGTAETFRAILPGETGLLPISARDKTDIHLLSEQLYNLAIGAKLDTGSVIVTNARHLEALQKTDQALAQVQSHLNSSMTSDFLATEIRQALYHLGEITGQVTTDDVLDNIFSKFCIGK